MAAEECGGGSVAQGVDPALYPVAVLIDELRHDEVEFRLRSFRNLGTIATALGPERTREELLPFLQEIIDDDDDGILLVLADQLSQGVPWVGGPAHAHALMGPLEELCSFEEISVREKATEVLNRLAAEMSPDQVARHFCALINRVAGHDWFTPRISACSLFRSALSKVGDAKQDDLLKTYIRLCGDDTPMVRRQAANTLSGVAEVLLHQESMLGELIEAFEKFSKDEQDSVRILAISNCIALGRLMGTPEWHAQILPVVKACAEDKSWRVRYMMADNVKQLCEVFKAKATAVIVPLFLRLLSDQEVEVRTIAAAHVCDIAELDPTKEFLETLVPIMEKLTMPREQSQHVRASLAGSILGLTPIFGSKLTVDYLINIFLHLIRDESAEVKLKLIVTLGELSRVVGLDVLSQSLLPAIKELSKDHQWRVRVAVIDCMPSLARHLGEAQFTTELQCLFAAWLVDPVFSVRHAVAANFNLLSSVLGLSWCEQNVVPQLVELLGHKNYLYRISATLCVGSLAEVVGGPLLEKHLVPMVVNVSRDIVPNVRFNAAKTIRELHKTVASVCPGLVQSELIPCLSRLVADHDPDVKFFAESAMSEMAGSGR